MPEPAPVTPAAAAAALTTAPHPAAPAAPASRHPARGRRVDPGSVATHAVLSLGALAMVFPFLWQLLTAFKTMPEAVRVPPTFLPEAWTWAAFEQVFTAVPFEEMLANSLLNTAGRTLGQLVFCSLAAYAFARLQFRGRNLLFALFLSVLMVPPQLLVLPQHEIMTKLGLLNSVPALFLPGMFSAFGTFLLRQFFLALPKELEEAARIDGAGPFRIFWSIMLPLVRPALAALAVITAMWSWNDLLWPLVVNTDPAKAPVSAGLISLEGQFMTNYPVMMAGSVIASLPMLLLYVLLQRHFVQGIALSGSKG
ncbi:carbohydrate ABC transporter permease [Streptomyces sp. WMMB 322]|uniref:carbohydrate ABC transporter permease n=1 Tax=Streptomyces sp. WMMB 322 TaxID=1286821 RepID=UPI000823A488|nr:carbohydrate ABC transporter permease [Streptomyces sp. WMMB 322]SCK13454.1 carbohydrate ABC transporter membrane protein 2, CUT1 family (TC 3.A.1.1.-) [Streptomyces sp. WMMB 322]